MILQPLGTRVLIKRKSIRKVGSIVVPNSSRQMEVNLGEVVSVGADCEVLKEGDLCTFGQYAPHKIDTREMEYYGITFNNEQDIELLLMNEEDALCIILKDKNSVEEKDQVGFREYFKTNSSNKRPETVKQLSEPELLEPGLLEIWESERLDKEDKD